MYKRQAESLELYNLVTSGKYAQAAPMYAAVHDLFNWDSRKEFIQAIKLAMDILGRYGGATRLPRLPLPASDDAKLRADVARAVAFFKNR